MDVMDMMDDRLSNLGVGEFCRLVEEHEHDFPEGVIGALRENGINGSLFLQLTADELKELAPRIADRVVLRELQSTARTGGSPGTGGLVTTAVEKGGCSSGPGRLATTVSEVQGEPSNITVSEEIPTASSARESRLKVCASYAPIPVSAITGDDQWHISFKIPSLSALSERSIDAIRTGIITKSVRTEVVQTLTTLIANHTKRPSAEQYSHICKELVKCYPALKDDAGNGYGSWKIKIRDRLKHMRRPAKRDLSDKENQPVQTPSKRRNTRPNRLDEPTEELEPGDEQSFAENVKEMECETAKKKVKTARLKPLMDSTFSGRRRWVKTDMPPVSVIMEKFPALKIPRLLRREFKAIVGVKDSILSLIETWPTWRQRILTYAKMEGKNRPMLRKLLQSVDSFHEGRDRDDAEGLVCLEVLTELLCNQATKRRRKILYRVQEGDDIDDEITKVPLKAPCIVVMEASEAITYDVVVEGSSLVQSTDLNTALLDLFSAYFVFDIVYPAEILPILIFFQHYVFGLKDQQKVPVSVTTTVGTLRRLD